MEKPVLGWQSLSAFVMGAPGQVLSNLVLLVVAAAASWHLVSFCETVISSLSARVYVCVHVKTRVHIP